MPGPNRTHLSDLRGVTRMAFDATVGVAGIVESMHRTIQQRPAPLGQPATGTTRGITGLVYRSIRDVMRVVGFGIDASLAPVLALLPEGESTPARDAFLSAVNGVYGDYLVRTDNPLAIEMSVRHHGRPVDLEHPARVFDRDSGVAPTGKLRSAGITDLRQGTITSGPHAYVPLPDGVKCYAAAASLGARRGHPAGRLVGDGLVPLDSALGQHRDASR